MRPTNSDERIRVRVNYVPRGYGLSLTISEDACIQAGSSDADEEVPQGDIVEPDAVEPCVDDHGADHDGDLEIDLDDADDGFLTVVKSGVTTLELRKADGQSSYLIWDQSEVDWDSLLAG